MDPRPSQGGPVIIPIKHTTCVSDYYFYALCNQQIYSNRFRHLERCFSLRVAARLLRVTNLMYVGL